MKIALLGATGQTGQYLVKQALEQGHTVTAVVRNPAKLVVHHDNLKVIKTKPYCRTQKSPDFTEEKTYRKGEACVSRTNTRANSGTQSPFLIRFLLLPMIRSVLSNMYEMERFLQKSEDINWTVVRPPGLKNLAASAQEFLTHEGYFVPDSGGQTAVGRGDVARFMLSLLNSNAWVKKGVAITTK
uniref:NAD(P)-binding domain-containing protein n=1 Tax=Cyprinodon variegatus TaxID=28743 RepID=A0A3Q2D4C1_CYPVA